MPTVKQGWVTKTKRSLPPGHGPGSSIAGTRLRRTGRDRDRDLDDDEPKPLPLVERTNNLSMEDFISIYLSSSSSFFETNAVGSTVQTKDQKSSTVEQDSDEEKKTKYKLNIYTAQSIPAGDFEACLDLIELTSSRDYADSGMGWSRRKKMKEMRLPDMRYLILRPDGGEVLGFLSFMVTYEDGKEVIYCYEIHLSPAAQGQGLGKELMGRFEEIGRRVGLEKAMLTVFKSNGKAVAFYERLGYDVDEFSPPPRTLRNGTVKEPEYLILSKPLKEASDTA